MSVKDFNIPPPAGEGPPSPSPLVGEGGGEGKLAPHPHLPPSSHYGSGGRPPTIQWRAQGGKGLVGVLRLPPDIAEPMQRSWSEAEAFAYCTALTQRHYENFPVGSFLVPSSLQPAVHSLYAFMRTSDDFSDENRHPGDEEERLAYLETWNQLLTDCEQGRAQHPIFIALRATLDRYPLPAQWLRDLLTAFKMDVTVRRYATYEQLLTYCRFSANPVGRLILTLFGYRDEDPYRLSDCICTGLQLANHWQDVSIDLEKDRIYLPQEDLARFGVTEEYLFEQKSEKRLPSPPPSPARGEGEETARWFSRKLPLPHAGEGGGEGAAFRRLMQFEVDRARRLFDAGRPLPDRVQGRLRWELRMTWHGGVRILDKIQAAEYDVFHHRPIVTKWDWLRLGLKTLFSLTPSPLVGEGGDEGGGR